MRDLAPEHLRLIQRLLAERLPARMGARHEVAASLAQQVVRHSGLIGPKLLGSLKGLLNLWKQGRAHA